MRRGTVFYWITRKVYTRRVIHENVLTELSTVSVEFERAAYTHVRVEFPTSVKTNYDVPTTRATTNGNSRRRWITVSRDIAIRKSINVGHFVTVTQEFGFHIETRAGRRRGGECLTTRIVRGGLGPREMCLLHFTTPTTANGNNNSIWSTTIDGSRTHYSLF